MRSVSRREFLRASALVGAGTVAAACAAQPAAPAAPAESPTTAPAAPAAPAAPPSKYQESPALAERVAKGELPPVEERLPEAPVVVTPLQSIGKYGGQWTSGTLETNGNDLRRNVGYYQLVQFAWDWNGVVPGVADSWESNEDGTEYTFTLRKGLKWSDGAPFTADDLVFYYEDVVMNAEISPVPPKNPYVIEKIDDYTARWKLEKPNGLFIKEEAQVDRAPTRHPKHYLQQFHLKYNADVGNVAKQAGYDSWFALFAAKASQHENPESPKLWPWIPIVGMGEGATRIICERNPYFFQVDTEGNQLPYLDSYAQEFVTDNEVLVLKALNGEIDFQEQWINAAKYKPVFYDGQEKGGFHFWTVKPSYANECIIMLNRDCTDPAIAEMAGNKDFRIGLSHAINRQELIDVVLVGQGEPHQAAPRPESAYYHERLAKQYTEYDVDKANEYLDKTGWTQRDSEGFRLGPDGKRIFFVLEIDQSRTVYVDMLELIKPMWAAVGVEVMVKLMERSLWEERCRARNLEFHGTAHKFGGGSGESPILDPRYWFPNSYSNCNFAKSWGAWYGNPKDEIAKEPPEDVKAAMALYDDIRRTPDETKQKEMLKQLLDMAADQFYCIGTSTESDLFGIVTNRMRNTPDWLPLSWIYPTPGPINTAQFYIEA
jgi:peptide/nickel transport system substrate-binding protein